MVVDGFVVVFVGFVVFDGFVVVFVGFVVVFQWFCSGC